MGGGKNQASTRPTALGSMLQASTYGLAIPVVYGLTQSPLLAIWAENLRIGGSGKKGKSSKKGGPETYVENVDFLLGHNPILGVLQMWNNNDQYSVNLVSASILPSGSMGVYGQPYVIADAHFLALIAVVADMNFGTGFTFNDYGSPGPVGFGQYSSICLWNAAQLGPDLMDGNSFRNWPWVYRWRPDFGATFYTDGQFGSAPFGALTAYYAQITSADNYTSPLNRNRLSFEAVLGSGDEYSGYSAQQIEYPWYAGAGSPNIDLGSSGTLPALKSETLGRYALYTSGDSDFVDVIEDILKSGQSQAALGSGLGVTPIQRGVNCLNYPGAIQKKCYWPPGTGGPYEVAFDVPVTEGNALLAVFTVNDPGTTLTSFSDTLSNVWTLAGSLGGLAGKGPTWIYYCFTAAGGDDAVQIEFSDPGPAAFVFLVLLEIPGVDTFDGIQSATGTHPTVSITTTNAAGKYEIVYAISVLASLTSAIPTQPAPIAILGQQNLWPEIAGPNLLYGTIDAYPAVYIQQRVSQQPQTFSMQWAAASGASGLLALVAFQSTRPPSFAKALPDILDPVSRELTRAQCRANGLYGSLSMDSQQAAKDWIDTLAQAADCAPVWSGFKLKLIPRSEVSMVGHGAIYEAPTSAGPVASLSTLNDDFVAEQGAPPITITSKARLDVDTILQMQHLSRASAYAQVLTTQPDPAGIALYGVRKAEAIVNNAIQDVAIARMILRIIARRQNYIESVGIEFTLKSRWQMLEAMDLITITDPLLNLQAMPVRLTSVGEDNQMNRKCTAEPYIYGIHAPQVVAITQPAPYMPNTKGSAGNVNAPIIFEPVARLTSGQSQIWLVVSSSSPVYGGCQIYVSTDGGLSYPNLLGTLAGSAVTGVSTGDWPAAGDPDTTNDLPLNVAESLGTLASYQTADEDNFTYPCYVASSGTIPYEVMTYAIATLTGTNAYTLKATGGNHLRRAVFGAPGAAGVDHPLGSRFAFLVGAGVLKVAMDPAWIGKTLYFKFLSINTFGGGSQSLSDVSAYAFTPTGIAQSASQNAVNYVLTPASSLSNPTSTSIAMAQVSAKFPTNVVNYNARSFTISAPGSPKIYYVCIGDPGFVGDEGALTNLTAYCETTSEKVGAAGFTFIGEIQALPAGGGTVVTPGGMPQTQQLFLVNGS